MSLKLHTLWILVVLGVCITPLHAADPPIVTLNGTPITHLRTQSIPECSVTIDDHGNILITAPKYAVRGAAIVLAEASTAAPVQKYWLVTQQSEPDMTQYNIDVFINGTWVRKFMSHEAHVVLDVTPFFHQGSNAIRLTAQKVLLEPRRSTAAQHHFRIIIGEGVEEGRDVVLRRKLVDYKRTAADMGNYNDEFSALIK
jgi:hypothetical protein